MKTSRLCRLVLVLCLLTGLSSCGTEFRKAQPRPANSPNICLPLHPPAVAGRWDGAWHSEATGHQGRLRCVVTGPVNQAGDHEFFYHATWMGFLSGGYKATHQVRKEGATYVFKGQHKMPDWAGGLYHYEGKIQGNEFKADYKSSADHGTYTMKRVH